MTTSALNTGVSIADADLRDNYVQEEVISELKEQGCKQNDAEAAVRASFRPGSDFSGALRGALAHVASARASGRISMAGNIRSPRLTRAAAATARRSSIPEPDTSPVGGVAASNPTSTRAATTNAARPSNMRRITRPEAGLKPAGHPENPPLHVQGKQALDTLAKHLETPENPENPENPLMSTQGNASSSQFGGKPCKCGCGELTKSNASPYVRGHNPNTKMSKPAKPSKTPRLRASAVKNGTERQHALAPALAQENKAEISEYELDELWRGLTFGLKLRMVFGRKESRKESAQ